MFEKLTGEENAHAKEVRRQATEAQEAAAESIDKLSSKSKALRGEAEQHVQAQAKSGQQIVVLFGQHLSKLSTQLERLSEAVSSALTTQVQALSEQNSALSEQVAALQRQQTDGLAKWRTMIASAQAELDGYESSMTSSMAGIQSSLQTHKTANGASLEESGTQLHGHLEGIRQESKGDWEQLEQREKAMQETTAQLRAKLQSNDKELRTDLKASKELLLKQLDEQAKFSERHAAGLGGVIDARKDMVGEAHGTELQQLQELGTAAQEVITGALRTTDAQAEATAAFVREQDALAQEESSALRSSTKSIGHVGRSIEKAARVQLAQGVQPLRATGSTPTKKAYDFGRALELAPPPSPLPAAPLALVSAQQLRNARQSNLSVAGVNTSFSSAVSHASRTSETVSRLLAAGSKIVAETFPHGAAGEGDASEQEEQQQQQQPGTRDPTPEPLVEMEPVSKATSSTAPASPLKDLSSTLNLPRGHSSSSSSLDSDDTVRITSKQKPSLDEPMSQDLDADDGADLPRTTPGKRKAAAAPAKEKEEAASKGAATRATRGAGGGAAKRVRAA